MGIVFNQGTKTTFVVYLGILLGYINYFFLYTKFLTPSEIGLISLLMDLGRFGSTIVFLGLPAIIIKYYYQFSQKQNKLNEFLRYISRRLVLGLAMFIILFFVARQPILTYFSSKAAAFNSYYLAVLLFGVLIALIGTFETLSNMRHNVVKAKFLTDVVLRIFYMIILLLIAFKLIEFPSLVTYFIVANLIVVVLLIGSTIRVGAFKANDNLQTGLSSIDFKTLNKYGNYVVLGSIGSIITNQIDSYMVSGMLGLDFNGIYKIAFFMAVVVEVPRRALIQTVNPFVSKNLIEDKIDDLGILYKQVSSLLFLSGSFIFLMVFFNIDFIYALIPNGAIYQSGLVVFVLIGLAKLVNLITSINHNIILNSVYYKFSLFLLFLLAGMTILLNLVLIKRMGMEGAALSTLISITVYNVIATFYVYSKFKIQPFSKEFISIIGLIVLTSVSCYFVPIGAETVGGFILRSAIISIIYFIGIFYFNVCPEVKQYIFKLLNIR